MGGQLGIAQILWLFGNYWWMSGELHDVAYPDAPPVYNVRALQAGHVLQSAMCFMAVYYLILKPLKVLDRFQVDDLVDDTTALQPRLPRLFPSWRHYEQIQYVLAFAALID